MVTTRSQLYPSSDFAKEHYGKGREAGLREGQAELLLLLLTQRFGALPAEISDRVHGAKPEELLTWGRRILSASTLADVFED